MIAVGCSVFRQAIIETGCSPPDSNVGDSLPPSLTPVGPRGAYTRGTQSVSGTWGRRQRSLGGSALSHEILRAAVANGIRRFRAYALADNHRLLAMLSRLTNIQQRRIEAGIVDLLFTRRGTPAATSRPEVQAPTFPQPLSQMSANTLDAVCALTQMNQRVLGELFELSSAAAKESRRAYAILWRPLEKKPGESVSSISP